METIVVKFGGSSLASAEQIKKAAAIVGENSARRFVVVSAPGKRSKDDEKVTDLLYRCGALAAAGEDFSPVLAKVEQRFAGIIEGLGVENFDLAAEMDAIRAHLAAPQEEYLASRGEHLNAKIIAAYLGRPFVETANVVVFDSIGRLDEEATNLRLATALRDLPGAVIPGFYGADAAGRIRTFSRGGSDLTGAIVARAVCADLYENWTDVSGMLSADPRIVENPRVISYITYQELRELAYMGASVMHEDAVFPAKKAGIPMNIKNTNAPADPGTMIVPKLPENYAGSRFTGIAGKGGFTSVQVEKSRMNGEVGFGARLLQIFAAHGVPFEHCPTGIDTMSVVVSGDVFNPERDSILRQIELQLQPDTLVVEDDLAFIAVVGEGMLYSRGTAALLFGALAEAGVNIRMIDQGSSELNIIIGVSGAEYETALRALYRAAFEEM